MSGSKQKTESLLAATVVSDTETVVFQVRSGIKTAAIQVNYVEAVLTASVFDDEDISLVADTITEVAHGYDTGLIGTLTVQTGTTSVFNDEDIDVSACMDCITEAAHDLTTGERGQLTAQIGTPQCVGFGCINVCTEVITAPCHDYTQGERIRISASSCALPDIACVVVCPATQYFVTTVVACTSFQLASTRANALTCTSVNFTAAGAGCHTFTPDGAVPAELAECVDYFIIDNGTCTYQLATTRALALAGTAIDIITLNSPATITFTACGAIPTGLTACCGCQFIIVIDDDTYQIASSRALATAGTQLNISTLESPASVTFTPTAAVDDGAGTVVFHSSIDGVNFACANLDCVSITIDGCTPANTNTVTNFTDIGYNYIQVVVDVTTGQFTIDIDATGKS